MAWPTGSQVDTSNLSTSTANPSLARIDLNEAVTYLNTIIADANQPEGALVLDGFGLITTDKLPNVMQVTGNLSLEPTTTIVNVRDTLRLASKTQEQLEASTATYTVGDIMVISDAPDGAGTGPAVCFYDGTEWKFMLFSSLTTLA
jgi:hypothetical protein